MNQKLIPELDVSDLKQSLAFYIDILGAKVRYERPEERFVFLDIEEISVMLQEATGPGRRFRTASLEKPFGRGVNFQIQVQDVLPLYTQVIQAGAEIIIPLEETWYRKNDHEVGNRQFVVADPDGYLLRFFSDLGQRTT